MKNWKFLAVLLSLISLLAHGQEKAWLEKKDSIFTLTTSEHFNLYCIEGHLSAKAKSEFLSQREDAYQKISDFFETITNVEVNIFLFQSEQLKFSVTGHSGLGWGFDNNIVEVYNDSIRVDSYHELTHVIGYTLNTPPALIDEGTAVYLSQIYENRAFSKLLGAPEKTINELLLSLFTKEELIDLSTFLDYEDIVEAQNGVLAYCQSASFVQFLIEEFGKEKFLTLFKSISNEASSNHVELFARIFEVDLKGIENSWIKWLELKR